jgi:uncharacterized protein
VSEELPFDPFPMMRGSHKQTIMGSILHWQRNPRSKRHLVDLPDGDKIAIEMTTPKSWKEDELTVVMVHGLCGSHKSPYLVRMARKLYKRGIRCVRINLRGCGSGKGHAKHIYHSGRSEDIYAVLKYLKNATPQSEMILIGFSLGANIVLKLAGELGLIATTCLRKVIAIAPPTDLYTSVQMLHQPENQIFERYFLKLLLADVKYRERKFSDIPKVNLPGNLTLYEFDRIYVAPQCGFKNAFDYYDKCSSKWVIGEIEVPCKILFSEDDPIIDHSCLDGLQLPDNVQIFKTKHGGHLGFLGSPIRGDMHWMDRLLLDWIQME